MTTTTSAAAGCATTCARRSRSSPGSPRCSRATGAISDADRREYASRIHAAAIEIGELVDALLEDEALRQPR